MCWWCVCRRVWLCVFVWCCVVWCGVCRVVWHAGNPVCFLKTLSVCGFKTSPCVPAPRAHETHVRVVLARGRFECTHGGVFESIHVFFFPHFFSVPQHTQTHTNTHTHQTHTTTTNNTTTTTTHHTTHHTRSHHTTAQHTTPHHTTRLRQVGDPLFFTRVACFSWLSSAGSPRELLGDDVSGGCARCCGTNSRPSAWPWHLLSTTVLVRG